MMQSVLYHKTNLLFTVGDLEVSVQELVSVPWNFDVLQEPTESDITL